MKTGSYGPRLSTAHGGEPHPLEALALWAFGGLITIGGLVWATGELAARLFGDGAWPTVGMSEIGAVLMALPRHLGEPAEAWPGSVRAQMPGPVAFYGTFGVILLAAATLALTVVLRLRKRPEVPGIARWAASRDLRRLHVHGGTMGRLILGRAGRRLVATESRQSAIVVGPTQTGKTSGFAIPAILEWQGPVVATSIKTDLLRETLAARSALSGARTFVYDPTGATGLPSAGWTPLMQSLDWQGAQRVSEWLVRGARTSSASNEAADFWYGATAKLLAPILLAAACSGGSMAQVVAWVDSQEDGAVTRALEANDEEEALNAFEAIALWDERTRGSVYATAQTVLIAYVDPGVLASALTAELRAAELLDGAWNTAYLCAPAHEQRRLRPLFATLVQEIVAHAYDHTAETGKPLDPPLLLVLDECANIAPLRDLATLASTGAGQGIQLVSVFQDMAQIYAVYGRDHAPTIVSNHRAKVILSGISDPQTLEYIARLLGDEQVPFMSSTSSAQGRSTTESVSYRSLAPANVLREMRPGQGVLVYGHLAPARITLRPWFKERQLRRIAGQPAGQVEGALR
jgi:type IV secretion system protein VirD4